ncbi:MAG: sialidase family protein [Verrucomicrobiota bacterium]|nr:sialidase family protein [Verrucomicrobiota bacterium]
MKLVVCLVLLLLSLATGATPLTIEKARVLVTGPGFNRPDAFPGRGEFSWAGNVQRLPDGELLLVHSMGYYHSSFAQPRLIEPKLRARWLKEGWPLDFHAPTGGRSMLTRSRDGGKTWSKPRTILDLKWDDGPCGLLRCNDGTLVCTIGVQASWYGYPKAPARFKDELGGANTAQCSIRSADNGKTWSQPVFLKSPGTFYERSHVQLVQLPNGRILWPTYFSSAGTSGKLAGAIHQSKDRGKSWSLLSVFDRKGDTADTASASAANIDEPALGRLPDGRLFLVCRPDGGRFFSKDGGRTWRYDGRLVTKGKFKAPRVFVLKDGTIVVVATYRNLQVWLGRNAGRDWTGPLTLDPKSYGYPGGTKLPDESLLISYCSSGRAPNSIYCARFRVNKKRNGIELLPLGGKLGSK